jgi:serine/threonine kinase 32
MHTSVAGSMAYMAPEVIGRKGYTWYCDFWSLGVTAYELLFHKRPFEGRTAEKMTHSILKDPIRFPNDPKLCSPAGIQLLQSVSHPPVKFGLDRNNPKQFLERSPTKRLGCRPNNQGFQDIQQHPWFSSIAWESLEAKESQPPFVPDVRHALWVSFVSN